MKQTGRKNKGDARFFWYRIYSGERLFGLKRHNNLHLYGRRNVWFLYPYKTVSQAHGMRDNDSKRIIGFWEFMDGDERYYPYFYEKYADAICQVLWITKTIGEFEIAVVPKSSPDKENILEKVCSEITRSERFILGKALDGTDLIKRVKHMNPVHRGGSYSADEIARSLRITRPLKAKKVILIDDLVFSGRTDLACRKLLKDAGAEEIYTVCMYGHSRSLC